MDPTIERKTLIYRSGLGFYCINHVLGCSHGCRYPCHAFLLAKRHGRIASYEEFCRPRLVGNAFELLCHELSHRRKLPERVHLCLSTDPFMFGHPEVEEMTLRIIERLNQSMVAVSILTKGILPSCLRDASRFSRDNVYAISLCSLDEDFRRRFEPGASPYAERVSALRQLAEAGFRTRIHMEPYPTPRIHQQDLLQILSTVTFAGSIFIGSWNYQPRVEQDPNARVFYEQVMTTVRRFCSAHGIACEA